MRNPLRHLCRLAATRLRDVRDDAGGLVAVEYGLIVAAFGGAIVVLFLIADDLLVLFNAIADSIAS